MADPLSVISGIAGLVTAAEIVASRTRKYVMAVRNVHKDIKSLSQELIALYGVLNSLSLVVHQFESEGLEPAARIHHVYSCQNTLETIRVKLDKVDPITVDNSFLVGKRKLQWPFSKEETKTMLLEVERHKTTLSLALSADNMSAMVRCLSWQDQIRQGVKELSIQLLEAETRVNLKEEHREMLSLYGQLNPISSHKAGLALRHPGTGIWLTEGEEYIQWLETGRSTLWLHGIPGAGKTVLMSSIIENSLQKSNARTAVAYFYCDYKDPKSQLPIYILGSIASQLAKQNGRALELMRNFYHLHHKDNNSLSPSEAGNLQNLVVTMSQHFDSVLLLVDGLDECDKNTEQVVELLAASRDTSHTIKTLFSSRDEADIRRYLSSYVPVRAEAHKADLRLYVGAEIEKRIKKGRLRLSDISTKEQIMEILVQGADGMFRWTACQLDYLCELPHDEARLEALRSLPPDLNSTYERILSRVNGNNKHIQDLVRKALNWIANSKEVLTNAALCEAISVSESSTHLNRRAIPHIEDVLRWCSSLVRRSATTDAIELAHYSVKEFLRSIDPTKQPQFQAYKIDAEFNAHDLAFTCLAYLNLDDFGDEYLLFTEANQAGAFHFRPYAVYYWGSHAAGCLGSDGVALHARKLLDKSKSSQFLSWSRDFVARCIRDSSAGRLENEAETANREGTASPLHFAAMLGLPELCKWLLGTGCDVNEASKFGRPLHCALLGSFACMTVVLGDFESEEEIASSSSTLATVQAILDGLPDVHVGYETGISKFSLLYISAVKLNDGELCKALLKAGATCEADMLDELECDGALRQVRSVICKHAQSQNVLEKNRKRFLELLSGEHTASTEQFLGDKSTTWNVSTDQLQKALFKAVQSGRQSVVEHLISLKRIDLRQIDPLLNAPVLHIAARKGFTEIVELLLRAGVEREQTDPDGKTALHWASEALEADCAALLIREGLNPKAVDNNGTTIIHIASGSQEPAVLEMLLKELGPDKALVSALDSKGASALIHAARSGSRRSLKLLWGLSDLEACLSCDGQSALHFAVKSGRPDAVDFLLDCGCDPNAVDKDGDSVLHSAVIGFNAKPKIIKSLIDKGADPNRRNSLGQTIFHLFCDAMAVGDSPEDYFGVAYELADLDSVLNEADEDGHTGLEILCDEGSNFDTDTVTEILLECKPEGFYSIKSIRNCLSTLFSQLTRLQKRRSSAWQVMEKIRALLGHLKSSYATAQALENSYPFNCLLREHNEERLLSRILDCGIDVDKRETNGDQLTGIEAGALYGCSPKLFSRLLEASKNIKMEVSRKDGPLHRVCRSSSEHAEAIAKMLLKAGVSVNHQGRFGRTPLMICARHDNHVLGKVLLSNRADLLVTDSHGWSAIHYAAKSGSSKILELFSPTAQAWCLRVNYRHSRMKRDIQQATVWHIAASEGKVDPIEYMGQNEIPLDIDSLTEDLETPLFLAVHSGEIGTVSTLLSFGASPALADRSGTTPLHLSASNGRKDLVKLLLQRGADTLISSLKGLTPSMAARLEGHGKIAQMIDSWNQEASMPVTSNRSVLPQRANSNLADGSLTRPSSSYQCQKAMHRRTMAYAIRIGDVECCERLVKDVDLDEGFPECLGCTPLLYALAHHQFDVAEFLLAKDASVSGTVCSKLRRCGHTVFHLCAAYGQTEILEELLYTYPEALQRESPVQTIHSAIAMGHLDTVETILDFAQLELGGRSEAYYEFINARIQKTDPSATWRLSKELDINDAWSSTPLHLACMVGSPEMVELLLEYGAKVNSVNDSFDTPLHIASSLGHRDLVQILCTNGAKSNSYNSDFETPYLLAAECPDSTIMSELERYGADTTARNMDGRSAIHYAIEDPNCMTVAYLLAKGQSLDDADNAGITALSVLLMEIDRPGLFGLVLSFPDQMASYSAFYGSILHSTCILTRPVFLKRVLRRLSSDQVTRLINLKSPTQWTPLCTAIAAGNLESTLLLLRAGADMEVVGCPHGTPLMVACTAGRLDVVRLLVRRGAELTCSVDGQRLSAVDCARQHAAVLRWLLVGRHVDGPRLIAQDPS